MNDMKGANLRFALIVVVAAQSAAAHAQSSNALSTIHQLDCPAPEISAPVYPFELASALKGGTVVLDLAIDACGRVLQAAVKTKSGHEKLDQSALVAARQWILPSGDRAKAVQGHVERPVMFSMSSSEKVVPYARLDWPPSHKRPRYALDPSFTEFSSANAANKAIHVSAEQAIASPYPGIQSQFFRYGNGQPVEYWLFVYRAGLANLAARYRLVSENGEPVVRLGLACDDKPDACDKAREFLLKGLPFAKAK